MGEEDTMNRVAVVVAGMGIVAVVVVVVVDIDGLLNYSWNVGNLG